MDRVMSALGAQVLDWGYKTDCCGGSFALTKTDIVLKLSHEILAGAKEVGAQAIVVACPLCQINLDSRQREVEKEYGESYNLPILYFTQLMGVAFGLSVEELMLDKHFVDSSKVLENLRTI
jgi:heterodisulfide reductase subunit B